MGYWIDTHCHMNDKERFDKEFDRYMQQAFANNVLRSNMICLNKEDYLYSMLKQKQYANLDVSFGYYPEDVLNVKEEDLAFLEEVIPTLIGIGEIGLDYHVTKEYSEQQKELFIRQIELANKYQKAIQVHSRDACKDTYDILKLYAKTKVVLHCYSYSTEMMKEFLKLGCYISFTGVVTFKNSKEAKENALLVPIDRMMIETDCPYLTPVPFRGQQNETAYVKYTGEYIANLRGMSNEALQEQLALNYREFFNL